MTALFFLIPLSLMMATLALGVFVWGARSGQFDDLEGPGYRVVVDDDAARLARLDEALWTFSPLDFIPHVRASDPGAERTPVLLASGAAATVAIAAAGSVYGPLAAGLLFPLVPAFAVFAGAGGLLALSTALLLRKRPSPTTTPGT